MFSKLLPGSKRDKTPRAAAPTGDVSETATANRTPDVLSARQHASGTSESAQDQMAQLAEIEATPIQKFGIGSVRAQDDAGALFDIVLVHGLMGKAMDTWWHEGTKTHWPRDLLTKDMTDCRIMTFGYNADIVQLFGPASTSRLTDHAKTLVDNLTAHRRKTRSESRPIIFIAHSLGGLVVQHALQYSADANGISSQLHLAQVGRCTYGLVFLGVPNHGSNKAAWGLMGTQLAKGLFQRPNEQILSALKRESELLSVVHEGFLKVLERQRSSHEMRIACFFEDIEIWGIGVVVDRQSAAIGIHPCLAIRANHMNMTKFDGSNDNGYKSVLEPLERWRDELVGSTNTTSSTEQTGEPSRTTTNSSVPARSPNSEDDLPYSKTWDAMQNKRFLPSETPFLQMVHGIAFKFSRGALFITHNENTVWSTGSDGLYREGQACELIFQTDGNLVIYIEGVALWESETHSRDAKTLLFRNESPYLSILDRNNNRLWDSSRRGQFYPWRATWVRGLTR